MQTIRLMMTMQCDDATASQELGVIKRVRHDPERVEALLRLVHHSQGFTIKILPTLKE